MSGGAKHTSCSECLSIPPVSIVRALIRVVGVPEPFPADFGAGEAEHTFDWLPAHRRTLLAKQALRLTFRPMDNLEPVLNLTSIFGAT